MADKHTLPVACEVLRTRPSVWNDVDLHRRAGNAMFPQSSRFLHPALEVQTKAGRGRCLIARDNVSAGELLLVDVPVATAASKEALAVEVCKQAVEGSDIDAFRKLLFGFCASGKDDETASDHAEIVADADASKLAALVELVVQRNSVVLDPPPSDGQAQNGEMCGIFPVAALINHALRPNCVRTCVGHTIFYRLVKDLSAGGEVLDNYFDLKLPRENRAALLLDAHGTVDEGPDAFDAPDVLTKKLARHFAEAESYLKAGKVPLAFKRMVKTSNECNQSGLRDPAFTDAFRGFADVASLLGDGATLQLEGLAMALEHATAREQYSVVSCQLTVQLLGAAIDLLPANEWRRLETTAREHCRYVYGPDAGVFDIMNPMLAARLAKAGAEVPAADDKSSTTAGKEPIADQSLEKESTDAKRTVDESADEKDKKKARVDDPM